LGKCAGRQELSQIAAVKEMVPSFGLFRDGKLLAHGEPDQIRIVKMATGQESSLERASKAASNDRHKKPGIIKRPAQPSGQAQASIGA
jgi:hypothetical protein